MSDPTPSGDSGTSPGARRWRKAFFTPALLRILLLLAIGAAVFAAYLVAWVHSRDAYFTARNFRILAGLSKQIESIVEVQSEGLRYGALGETVEEEVRQESELSISYRDGDSDEMQTHRVRLASSAAPPKPAQAPGEPLRPVLGFEAYPEGAYLETAHPKNPRKLALEPLLDPLLTRDVFDHVVVADASGKVLFEKENREIRLAGLEGLGAQATGKEGEAAGWLRGRQATTRVHEVDLSGTLYDIFITPLRVPVARAKEDEGAGPWLVCGLVRSDRFRDESLALPRQPLLGFVALLAVLLLAWPLLKLKSMRGWEHLSRTDLVWLAASMFLIPALLTLVIWGRWRFQSFDRMWDRSLEEVAGEIDRNFATEVRAYEELLAQVDRAVSQGAAVDGLLARLPFLDVSWIRRDGCQVQKINFGAPKILINVQDREYFRSLARDIRPASGARRTPFVESINSWTTGEPELVIALDRPFDPEVPVVAMAVPLVSLIDTVLPPGFEYAVVQNSPEVQGRRDNLRRIEVGEVILHSDKRRNLRESFLQETADPERLAALVTAQKPAFDTIVYQGKVRRIYTRPLAVADRPWSLVLLADSEVLSDFYLGAASLALALTVVYGILAGLLFLVYSLVRGPGGFDWLWPRTGRLPAYAALIAVLTALLLVYLYVLIRLGPTQWMLYATLFPLAVLAALHEALGRREESRTSLRIVSSLVVLFLGGLAVLQGEKNTTDAVAGLLIVAAVAILVASAPEISGWIGDRLDPLARRRQEREPGWRWGFERPRRRHQVCIALGAVLLAVPPTVSFFNLALDIQLDGLVSQTQSSLASRLEEKEKRLGRDLGERFAFQPLEDAAAADVGLGASPAAQAFPPAENRCEGTSTAWPTLQLPAAGPEEPAPAVPTQEPRDLLSRWLEERLAFERRYEYGHFLFDTCVCYEAAEPAVGPARTCFCREPSRTVAATRSGDCQARAAAPWMQGQAGTASASLPEPAGGVVSTADQAWRVRKVSEAGGACYELKGSGGSGARAPLSILTRVPLGSLAPSNAGQALLFALAIAAAATLFFFVLRFATSMLFFLGLREGEPEPAEGEDLLHLAIDRSDLPVLDIPPEGSGWRLFDLRETGFSGDLALADEDCVVVIDHFDEAGADEARQALLRAARNRRLVLLCDRLPNRYLMPDPGALAGEAPPAPLVFRQGGQLRLVRTRDELDHRLRKDSTLLADVEILERWFVLSGADQRRVLDLLGEMMRPVFELKWASLDRAGDKGREWSQEEKILLWALVRGKWITAKAGRRLRHLADNGFVTQDPRLRIVSRSHAIFIREQTAREGEEALRGLDQSPWQRLKTPLAIAVVLLLAFLFLTQRDLFDNTVATVGALGGGMAALMQFLSDLRGKQAGSNG